MKKLEFDFPGVQFATVEAPHLDTGLTLARFDVPAFAAVDIRGGAAAVREASCIEELNSDGVVDAIVLAGGSTYGLEAASGVMKKLFEERQYSTVFQDIPCVPSAIVYDFRNRQNSKIYPDREMGEKAFSQLQRNQIHYGRAGAGANVHCGKVHAHLQLEKSGQGVAFSDLNGFKVLAITVVNSMGNILNYSGDVVRGSRDPSTGQRKHIHLEGELLAAKNERPGTGNTTISLLITNTQLDRLQLKRLAVMIHTGMARMIEPFHSPWDGDCLFAVSTGEKKLIPEQSLIDLCIRSTTTMQKAVLNSYEAD